MRQANLLILLPILLLLGQTINCDEMGNRNITSLEVPNDAASCIAALQDIFQEAQKGNMSQLLSMLLYSGHNLNDIGQYKACTKKKDMRFIAGSLSMATQGFSIFLGFCGPAKCQEVDYQEIGVKNIKVIEDMFSKIMRQNLTGMVKIGFGDPSINHSTINFWTYFAFIFCGLIVIAVILATIWKFISIKLKEMKEQNNYPALESSLVLNDSTIGLENNGVKTKEKTPPTAMVSVINGLALQENYPKWIPEKEAPDTTLNIFHGLRFINMFWIIWGHQYMMLAGLGGNAMEIEILFKDPFLAWVFGGEFAVDVFFFMSGFFFAFVALRKLTEKDVSAKTYFLLLLHRVLRIIPAYFVCILLYWKIIGFFGTGPFWGFVVQSNEASCKDSFWHNLLFIQNYTDNSGCASWGWYLANDMQMFLIMPIVTFILLKNKTMGKTVLWLLMIGCVVYSFGLAWKMEWKALSMLEKDFFSMYYGKPWCRIAPYIWGVFLCMWYFDWKKQIKQNTHPNWIRSIKSSGVIQAILVFIGLGIIYYLIVCVEPFLSIDKYNWSRFANSLYISASRLAFVMALSLAILPCLLGNGQWMNNLFGNKFFAVFAKLTFSMYLMHIVVMNARSGSSEASFHIDHLANLQEALISTFLTFLVAVVLHLFVELPFANLEQLLLKGKEEAKKETSESDAEKAKKNGILKLLEQNGYPHHQQNGKTINP